MSLLNELLSRPVSRPVIVSEQHDLSKIAIELPDFDKLAESRIAAMSPGGWDANEYGITREQAIARVRAADTPENREQVMRDLVAMAIRRAGLDTSTGKVAVFVAGKAPWHKLGVNVESAVDSHDAMRLASLDWSVDKISLQYVDSTGTVREAKDVFGIVRQDTGAMLGSVGNRYVPVQNREGFEFLDSVLGAFGAKYESAGAIYNGRKVWMLVKLPEQAFKVNGSDEITPYALFCNPHDGTGVANCFPTSERVVCANTYRVARNSADDGIKIRHTGNIRAKIGDAQRALGLAVEGFDRFKDQTAVLSRTALPDAESYVNGVLDRTYEMTADQVKQGADELVKLLGGDPKNRESDIKALERKIAKRGEIVTDIIDRYESERCGVNGMRGTAWAGFNAVTEYADHSSLVRYKGSDNSRASRRFESAINGEGDEMKQVAFEHALALAN